MSDLSWGAWAIMALAAFGIGISKTGIPGIGILSILMTAAVIPAKASTGVILPMLILGDLFAVWFYRRHAVWLHLMRLIPCAVAGVIVGWLALDLVNDRQLRPIIGAIVLTMIALNWWRMRRMGLDIRIPQGWWFPVLMGFAAGVTTMMANAAGPIMVIYLLAMRLPKSEFIGTGAWYFLLLNLFKVPFSASLTLINPASLWFNLILAPLVITGALIGIRLARHIPEKSFNTAVQILAVMAGLYLLIP
ncbi:MAG: sulfite exporter TauE/SafE family protein [bacterium]